MIESLLSYIQTIFLSLGPWGVLLLAFVQEIVPPIPSTLVTVSAGFVFLAGEAFSWAAFLKMFLYVGLPIAVGLTLGSLIIYGVVYWGGKPLVLRYGRYAGLSWEDVEKIQSYMRGHAWDDVVFFLARSFPLMPSVAINVFSGLVRWPLGKFALYTFFGTIIRSMWSGFLGWEFAHIYQRYATVIENTQNIVFLIVLIAVGAYLYHRKRRARLVETPATPPEKVVQ
ncbi:MAG: hypothetical protein AMXMBFR44_1060 [Candidatus Campbellbacteria bacterium]